MPGKGELGVRGLDRLTVDLVGPSTVVSEDSGRLSDVEALGDREDLSVVESLEGGEDVDVSLNQRGDLHQQLASLETGSVLAPSRLEGLVGTVESVVDIGGETLGDLDEDLTGGGVVDAAGSAAIFGVFRRRLRCVEARRGFGPTRCDSLDRLGVAVLGGGPLAVDVETGGDFDLALETGVVELVSECRSHCDCFGVMRYVDIQ